MSSELCKSCIHTKVCIRDKNRIGDMFVMGNPICFDNEKLWRKYKKWEAAGFPCEDYLPERESGKWLRTSTAYPYCSVCGWMPEEDEMTHGDYNFCPQCGAKMIAKK